MSLTVDGVWKAGCWATTAWTDGVWREGAVEPPVEAPSAPRGGGGRVYAYLPPEKKKRKRVIEKPTPYEVSGPLSRQKEQTTLPQWDEEAWEASLKSLKYLEEEKRQEKRKRQKRTEAALLLLLLR